MFQVASSPGASIDSGWLCGNKRLVCIPPQSLSFFSIITGDEVLGGFGDKDLGI